MDLRQIVFELLCALGGAPALFPPRTNPYSGGTSSSTRRKGRYRPKRISDLCRYFSGRNRLPFGRLSPVVEALEGLGGRVRRDRKHPRSQWAAPRCVPIPRWSASSRARSRAGTKFDLLVERSFGTPVNCWLQSFFPPSATSIRFTIIAILSAATLNHSLHDQVHAQGAGRLFERIFFDTFATAVSEARRTSLSWKSFDESASFKPSATYAERLIVT